MRRNHILTELWFDGKAEELVLLIRKKLREHYGSVTLTAKALDISRANLKVWLKRLDLVEEAREISRRNRNKFLLFPEVSRGDVQRSSTGNEALRKGDSNEGHRRRSPRTWGNRRSERTSGVDSKTRTRDEQK